MKIDRSIQIAAPPAQVYEVLMDPNRLEDWVTVHAALHDPPDRLVEGAEMGQSIKVAGQRFKVEWVVVEADAPRSVRWDGCGPLGTTAKVHYVLEDRDGGTAFQYVNEYEFPGGALGRLGAKAFEWKACREADRSLERLKGLLER